jgi:predicted esterase
MDYAARAMKIFLNLICWGCLLSYLKAGDFFSVEAVDYLEKAPKKGAVFYQEVEKESRLGEKYKEWEFIPYLKVRLMTEEQIKSSTTYVKAYFYNAEDKLIASATSPSLPDKIRPTLPVFRKKKAPAEVYFPLPSQVTKTPDWKALIVFGDRQSAATKTYPSLKSADSLDFPEKKIVESKQVVERKPAIDPLVELVVKTENPRQPQITLFARPPLGMTDATQAKGVLALCLLAGSDIQMKRQLQEMESSEEASSAITFANKHQLVILGWGSRSLWNPYKSWDEQSKDVNQGMDETFDDVAKAWAKGVEELSKKYGFPNRNFLLRGASGSAQYACRLALRKPEYFLAIHAHIPSSFDQPTPEANRILWCLTTGELEVGYERSKRFYAACRALGYPMIYKAIIGLGHSGHSNASNLGEKFFEYALGVLDKKEAFEASLLDPLAQMEVTTEQKTPQPWLDSFQQPAYVGDIVNQEMYPYDQIEMVPKGFRVPLPTKELAEAWNRK